MSIANSESEKYWIIVDFLKTTYLNLTKAQFTVMGKKWNYGLWVLNTDHITNSFGRMEIALDNLKSDCYHCCNCFLTRSSNFSSVTNDNTYSIYLWYIWMLFHDESFWGSFHRSGLDEIHEMLSHFSSYKPIIKSQTHWKQLYEICPSHHVDWKWK